MSNTEKNMEISNTAIRSTFRKVIRDEIIKNLTSICSGNSDNCLEHICRNNFCKMGLIRKYEEAYRNVIESIHNNDLEGFYAEQLYNALRKLGLSHSNAREEASVKYLCQIAKNDNTYVTLFEVIWSKVEEAKNSDTDNTLSSDDDDYNESEMEDTHPHEDGMENTHKDEDEMENTHSDGENTHSEEDDTHSDEDDIIIISDED